MSRSQGPRLTRLDRTNNSRFVLTGSSKKAFLDRLRRDILRAYRGGITIEEIRYIVDTTVVSKIMEED